MNPLTLVIAGLVVLGTFSLVAFLGLRAQASAKEYDASFRPLYVLDMSARNAKNAPGLVSAINLALEMIRGLKRWPEARIVSAVTGLRIEVVPTLNWTDETGRKLAGVEFSDFKTIAVGSNYAALLHEFLHICEARIDGFTTTTHAGWDTKGFFRLQAQFEQELNWRDA